MQGDIKGNNETCLRLKYNTGFKLVPSRWLITPSIDQWIDQPTLIVWFISHRTGLFDDQAGERFKAGEGCQF